MSFTQVPGPCKAADSQLGDEIDADPIISIFDGHDTLDTHMIIPSPTAVSPESESSI